MEKFNSYKQRISSGKKTNRVTAKIYENFFLYLKKNPKGQKEIGIKVNSILNKNFNFTDFIEIEDNYCCVNLTIEGITINFIFIFWIENQERIYTQRIESLQETNINSDYCFYEILKKAIKYSNLKNKYITFERNSFSWDIKKPEIRTFDDIFLPDNLINDLKLYVDIASDKNVMLRYLFVSAPGTGKTESCIVLLNELLKRGVTVIKTPVDEYLRDKINLAEILSPCVIILDDIDLSLGSRSNGNYNPELLSMFLDCLDGTDKIDNKVGILATTNASHLIDLAAQRPGRFSKILFFNTITKDNVKNIILKSLRVNFAIDKEDVVSEIFTSNKIIDLYYNNKLSGAHIFNSIYMLKLKMDSLKKDDLDESWIIKEINLEISTIGEMKNQKEINDKYSKVNNEGRIGFCNNEEENIVEEELKSCSSGKISRH